MCSEILKSTEARIGIIENTALGTKSNAVHENGKGRSEMRGVQGRLLKPFPFLFAQAVDVPIPPFVVEQTFDQQDEEAAHSSMDVRWYS